MAILDVLRYDPLHSWSISPVRLAKLQDAQSAAPAPSTTDLRSLANEKPKDVVNEPSEADRALTVVRKKLSKTLSVTATVNDLINQATDERNLAVLYSGMFPPRFAIILFTTNIVQVGLHMRKELGESEGIIISKQKYIHVHGVCLHSSYPDLLACHACHT